MSHLVQVLQKQQVFLTLGHHSSSPHKRMHVNREFLILAFVCVYARYILICVHTCMGVHCTHVTVRVDASLEIRCLLQSLHFLGHSFSHKLELTDGARLLSQYALGIPLSLLPSSVTTNACCHAQIFTWPQGIQTQAFLLTWQALC